MTDFEPPAEWLSWGSSDDPDHPGRFCAECTWDDPVEHLHDTLRVINEGTAEEALRYMMEFYLAEKDA